MRILSWNILQGGGKRALDIADAISEIQPDIAVLQEFRNGSGAAPILDTCRSLGLEHVHRATGEARKNTVMVASRYPIDIAPVDPSLDEDLLICASIDCNTNDVDQLTLFAGHLPQKKSKYPILTRCTS